jgi:hypothetical protein
VRQAITKTYDHLFPDRQHPPTPGRSCKPHVRDWVPIAASYPAEGHPRGQIPTSGQPLIHCIRALLTVPTQNIPSTMSVYGIKVQKRSLVRKVETAVDGLS